MKVIDDGTKKLTKFNRNYFFVVTVFVTVLCITLHATLGSNWNLIIAYDFISRFPFFNFFGAFAHFNWQHCLLNMLCFFICGCWLERKEGSLRFFGLTLIMILATSYAFGVLSWVGYSGVNYALYAYAIIDFALSLRKSKRNLFNIIGGAVIMALIYFAMCFNGGVERVGFEWYPYDLFTNSGHYGGFIVGFFIAVLIQGFRYLKSNNKFRLE